MANRSFYYGSLGRQASGISTLDGVPFKIAPNFRQSPKVISLPILEGSGVSDAFNEEYSFETEEAVLAWSRAREEAIKKAKQDEAERAAKAAAAQKAAASKQNTSADDVQAVYSAQKEQTTPDVTEVHSNGSVQGTSQKDINDKLRNDRPGLPPKPPIPKPAPKPGSILKPIPIQQMNKASDGNDLGNNKPAVPTSAANEGFDITMFEQEADPFDNLELQTLDDMEELKVLLDSTPAPGKKENPMQSSMSNQMNIPVSGSDHELNASEGFYELAGPISNPNAWVTFDSEDLSQTRGSPALSIDSNKAVNMASSSDSPISDSGDYVKLTTEQILPAHTNNSNPSVVNGITAQASTNPSTNFSTQQGNPFGSQLPPHLAETGIFKPVLPPIPKPKPRQSVLSETPNNNSISQNIVDQTTLAILPASSSVLSSNQDALKKDQTCFPGATSISKPNGVKPARVAPPPPFPKPSVMWSSVGPSLASSLDNNSMEESNKTNPYSRHSMEWHGISKSPDLSQGQRSSPIPPDRVTNSPSQPWNHYRPLPATPVPGPFDNIALPQKASGQPMGLTDPYHSLSKEAQSFVDRITAMGFLRAKVARAVDKFGQDEKEVLDHLLAVDTLVQKNFAPLYAEIALRSCQNDCEKAESFLKMQSQFEELGFTSEKIQDALIKSDMNHDKALDLLTACSP